MAESQKEAASATKPPKKGSLLDEEMGNDFFGSWKTMSTKGGGDLDFKEAAAPKGKKSAFNFDNLDMDFSLDGDFGKNISSFKVDMDLDFSSPPRKVTKSKDQSAKESNLGKQGKQDGFNFSFDFDDYASYTKALDSFDLDSSLTKKDKKCDNPPDDQGFNAPEKHENDQGPKRNLAKSIDAPEDGVSLTCKLDNFDMDSTLTKKEKESDKFSADKIFSSPGKQEKIQDPKRDHVRSVDVIEDGDANKPRKEAEHVVTSDVDHLIGSFGKYGSKNIDSPSVSMDLASYFDTKTLPEKEIISSGKETEEYSEQSEKTVYTEPNAVEAVQESSNRSVSVDDSTQNAPESQAEVCSSATEVNINPEEKQDFSVKPIAGLDSNPVKSCNMECSPANSQPMGTDNELSKKLENQTDIPMEDVSMDGSVQGDTNIEDASVANTEAKLPSTQPRKENKVVTKLLPTILHSEPKIQKLSALKVKGLDLTHSKPLTQSVETGKQLKTTAVPRKICAVVNKKLEVVHLSPPDARRQEVNPSDAQAGSRKFGSSMSHYKVITTDVPVELGIEKNNNNQKFSPSFQAHSASLVEKRTDPKTQKGLNSRLLISSTPSTKNLKSNSIEGNKLSPLEAGRKKLDVTSLKALKPVMPKNDFLHAKVGIEMTSLKRTDGNATEHISPLAKMDCAGGVDQQGLSSPSMKRKMLEVPKAYQVTPYPLKRVIESPSGSRDDPEIFEKLDNKRVRSTLNQLDSFRSSPTFDIPRNAYLKELEVPLLVENDGVVEKAEAYAKELENICNMLKKKNEEAKEILVRAVVTNNNLLMLNHPIYEEKIRNIQRLASRMVSMELGT